MLQFELYKSSASQDGFLSSKKIDLADNSTALLQITCSDEKLGSFIENTVIDLILTNPVAAGQDIYTHFGYLLERLNKYLKEIEKNSDFSELSIFLGLIHSDVLHFSILRNSFAYLIKGGKIINIAEGMGAKEAIPQFSYISSGAINPGDALCISNTNILDSLTKEDIFEIVHLEEQKDEKSKGIVQDLIDREIPSGSTHIFFLVNKTHVATSSLAILDNAYVQKTLAFTQEQLRKGIKILKESPSLEKHITRVQESINLEDRFVRGSLFGIGIIVSVFFLYLILSSLFSAQNSTTVPEEYKNKLIEAQLIIEKSNKDLGNREVFNENIKKAEGLIFEVRDKQIFLNDVKKLLTDISILKKQMNGVESFDPKPTNAEYLFTDTAFGLQNVFEVSKKLYFVGKNSLIGPYVKGGEVKTYTYPDGEEALSSDTSGDGYIYIFTKTGRLIRFYKGEFVYVNVEGQKTWEKAKEIRFFNSNLYVLSEDGQQIYKHKPGVNGFASRTDVLDTKDTKGHNIISFGVDGGFYLLKEDLSIDKIFGLPSYSKKSIIINNLPENYIQDGNESPKFFIAQNLNYIYLLLSNRIWIFEPDSKNYRDVKSVKYIGQIEAIDGKIHTIFVPKDGTIIAGSDVGIYTINFEVSDGKVIVR